ncbi:hypothetical protein OG786_10365 [Streptomyces sp. NBC_00101]|uniref:hypothetical protein n=1 Tax=Streptomyces sp. NBC_00101 TaxID=2975651 RepID=UPI003251B307
MAATEGSGSVEGSAGADGDPAPDAESVVLDVSLLAPADLAALPPSVFGETLRRLRDSCMEGDPFVTGHMESA